jgi:hypothetical protein
VQDDWRVTNKLTLSYGLRWDYESPITERNNQINAGFAFTANSPVQVVDPLQPGLTLKGGLSTFLGQSICIVRGKRVEGFQYVHAVDHRRPVELHLQRPDLANCLHPAVFELGADVERRVPDHPST